MELVKEGGGQSAQGDCCHPPSEEECKPGRIRKGSNCQGLGEAEVRKPSRGQR